MQFAQNVACCMYFIQTTRALKPGKAVGLLKAHMGDDMAQLAPQICALHRCMLERVACQLLLALAEV